MVVDRYSELLGRFRRRGIVGRHRGPSRDRSEQQRLQADRQMVIHAGRSPDVVCTHSGRRYRRSRRRVQTLRSREDSDTRVGRLLLVRRRLPLGMQTHGKAQ